jgi:hypothetical protein
MAQQESEHYLQALADGASRTEQEIDDETAFRGRRS